MLRWDLRGLSNRMRVDKKSLEFTTIGGFVVGISILIWGDFVATRPIQPRNMCHFLSYTPLFGNGLRIGGYRNWGWHIWTYLRIVIDIWCLTFTEFEMYYWLEFAQGIQEMRIELRPTWTQEWVYYWRTPFWTMTWLEKKYEDLFPLPLAPAIQKCPTHFGDPPGSNAKIIGNGSLSHSLQGGFFLFHQVFVAVDRVTSWQCTWWNFCFRRMISSPCSISMVTYRFLLWGGGSRVP